MAGFGSTLEGSETEVHAFLSQVCETKKANITSVETETQTAVLGNTRRLCSQLLSTILSAVFQPSLMHWPTATPVR